MIDTPQEAAAGDKAARELLASEKALQVKHQCCARISLGAFYGTKACGKTAKFEREGKHYCGTHDPVTIAEKQAIKVAAWRADMAAKNAATKARIDKQAEIERRADCYTELLEALKSAIKTAEFEGHPYRGWHSKANDAIAKAEGKA